MSKKTLKIATLIAAVAFAATASAEVTIDSAGTSIGTQAFKPSNNVTIKVASVAGDATATPPTMGGFSAISNHASGDRVFGTNSLLPKIFWITKDATNNITSITNTATAAAEGPTLEPDFAASWSSL